MFSMGNHPCSTFVGWYSADGNLVDQLDRRIDFLMSADIQILYLQLVTLQTSRSERWYHKLSCRDGWIPRFLCCLKSRGGNHSRPWMPMQDGIRWKLITWHVCGLILPSPMPSKANHVRSSCPSFVEDIIQVSMRVTLYLIKEEQIFTWPNHINPNILEGFQKVANHWWVGDPHGATAVERLGLRTIPHPTRSNLRSVPWIWMDLGSNVALHLHVVFYCVGVYVFM